MDKKKQNFLPLNIKFKSIWINNSYNYDHNDNIYLYFFPNGNINDGYIQIYDNINKKSIILTIQSLNKKIFIRFYN